jgi:Ca2+:H+ antiporter
MARGGRGRTNRAGVGTKKSDEPVRGFHLSLNTLLILVPIAILFEYLRPESHTLIFFTACAAIIPLAGLMGRATEQIADHAGEGIGGLLNATFGNAAELIIAIVALRAGQIDIVKASLVGSIIGNVLLVLGDSFLAGGLRYKDQHFDTVTARAQAQMLLVSALAVTIPALFHAASPRGVVVDEGAISLAISCLLIVVYALSLIFSLGTHKHMFEAAPQPAAHGEPQWGLPVAIGVLAIATFFIAWLSEILVGSVEPTAAEIGMSKVFVGVVIVAVIGTAAEHYAAVMAALRNRMDLSVGIAIGSSTQIALFVTPLLVLLSYLIAPSPMDLIFTVGETFALVIAAFLTAHTTSNGHSNWFTGVLLLSLYFIVAVGFFHAPA